jgi:hypothetical protein
MKASSISFAALTLSALLLLSSGPGTVAASLIPKKYGIKTLVLLDDWSILDSHSIFFDSLKRDGHELQFENANPPPPIKYYDEYFYDNIILMAPAAKGRRIPSFKLSRT